MRTYEALAEKSSAMHAAARRNEWDTVIRIENECRALIGQLRTSGDPVPLNDRARQRKVQLIRSMLAQDAEIRELAQPWMADLSRLLRHRSVQRKVERAYG